MLATSLHSLVCLYKSCLNQDYDKLIVWQRGPATNRWFPRNLPNLRLINRGVDLTCCVTKATTISAICPAKFARKQLGHEGGHEGHERPAPNK